MVFYALYERVLISFYSSFDVATVERQRLGVGPISIVTVLKLYSQDFIPLGNKRVDKSCLFNTSGVY